MSTPTQRSLAAKEIAEFYDKNPTMIPQAHHIQSILDKHVEPSMAQPHTQRILEIVAFCQPEPQGSMKAFMPKGAKFPIVTSDNKNLKSFRQEVSKAALLARSKFGFNDIIYTKHEPVYVAFKFFFQRPPSIPKKRILHVVRPDLSKLIRAAEDSLTGIIYLDDSQIVGESATKAYGDPERVEIKVFNLGSSIEELAKMDALFIPEALDLEGEEPF